MFEFKPLWTLLEGELSLLTYRLPNEVLDFEEFLFELEEIAKVSELIHES